MVISASGDIDISGVSTVCADYRELIRSLCSYMSEYGRVRTALFGYLPDSASDIVKRHAFESFMIAHDQASNTPSLKTARIWAQPASR